MAGLHMDLLVNHSVSQDECGAIVVTGQCLCSTLSSLGSLQLMTWSFF